MNAAVAELLDLLGTVAEHHIVEVPTPRLEQLVRRKLGRSPVLKDAAVEDVVLAVAFEAASAGRGPSFQKTDGSPAYPLLAAKHLFGLGEYSSVGLVPDTTETLAFLRRKAGGRSSEEKDVAGPGAYSIRSQIAVYASKLGTNRTGVRKERNGPLIAQYLLDQIEIELDSDTLARRIAPRVADIAAQRGKVHKETPPGLARLRPKFRLRRRIWIAGSALVAIVVAGALIVPRFMPDPLIASDPQTDTADYWHAGWGPDRETFTIESGGAPYPVFNSITNNADYGDERNFLTLKPADDNRGAGGWADDVWANDGDEFAVRIYGENSGFDAAADVPAGSLQEARAAFFISEGDNEFSIGGILSAKNAISVWDGAIIHTPPGMRLDWDLDSPELTTNALPKGVALEGDPFSKAGALLGYEEQDGIVKPGYEYSFYVTATLRVSAATGGGATTSQTQAPAPAPTSRASDASTESGSYGGHWGPDRDLFTVETPAPYAVLNSISNNPAHGFEPNFVQVRKLESSNELYADVLLAEPGDVLVVYAWVANDASDTFANSAGTIHGLAARTTFGSISDTQQTVAVILSAKNATDVWDGAVVVGRKPIELEYVEGSANFHTNQGTFEVADVTKPDALLGQTGPDGELPVGWDNSGKYQGSGFLTFRVNVVAAD